MPDTSTPLSDEAIMDDNRKFVRDVQLHLSSHDEQYRTVMNYLAVNVQEMIDVYDRLSAKLAIAVEALQDAAEYIGDRPRPTKANMDTRYLRQLVLDALSKLTSTSP